YLWRANDDALRAGQILETVDARGIAGGHDEHGLVAGEDPGRRRHAAIEQRLHLPLVRAGEHVARRAVLDLRAQLLRTGQVERDLRARMRLLEAPPDLGERFAEGRRRE